MFLSHMGRGLFGDHFYATHYALVSVFSRTLESSDHDEH